MSNRICKRCKSANVVMDGTYCGTAYYRCETCHHLGDKDEFPEATLFARITASPEVLAEKLVYSIKIISGCEIMYSSNVLDVCYNSREKAIRATVAKLKEVKNA